MRNTTFSTMFVPLRRGRDRGGAALFHVIPHGCLQNVPESPPRLPAEEITRLRDVRYAAVAVVVAAAVELVAQHAYDFRKLDCGIAEMLRMNFPHQFRHSPNRGFVVRRPYVENLAVADTPRVLHD